MRISVRASLQSFDGNYPPFPREYNPPRLIRSSLPTPIGATCFDKRVLAPSFCCLNITSWPCDSSVLLMLLQCSLPTIRTKRIGRENIDQNLFWLSLIESTVKYT